MINTPWRLTRLSSESRIYVPLGYVIWSRTADGERIFTLREIDEAPKDGDGGYRGIAAAIKSKFGGVAWQLTR